MIDIEAQIKLFVKTDPEKAFRLIFSEFYQLVTKVAFYITKSQVAAEDLSQEVFMNLWAKKNDIDTIGSLKGFLLTAIKNKALNFVEADKNRLSRAFVYLELSDSHGSDSSVGDQSRQVIEKMVNNLAPRTRLIFSLSRFEGLTNDEISSYLSISKRTVETQISLAIKALKGLAKENSGMINRLILMGLLISMFFFGK